MSSFQTRWRTRRSSDTRSALPDRPLHTFTASRASWSFALTQSERWARNSTSRSFTTSSWRRDYCRRTCFARRSTKSSWVRKRVESVETAIRVDSALETAAEEVGHLDEECPAVTTESRLQLS